MFGSLKRIARLSSRERDRRPRIERLERRDLLTQFTVTNTMDSGQGSLRQAILLANADNTIGADTISFKIGTGGTQTIALQSALPAITRSVAIDGTTQAGTGSTTGAPTIVIDGTNAGAGANGLTLSGSTGGSEIRGLAIVNFKPATDGSGGRGIIVADGGGDDFLGNYLGVNPDGTTAAANAVGIEIRSANNVVGSTTTTAATTPGANLISGNTGDGVLITGSAATGNQVVGNRIGTDITGSVAVGNLHGVTIASASNNTIGGGTANLGNLISGNAGPDQISGVGVYITGTAGNNTIAGNEIGTNQAGTGILYNTYGIYLGTIGVLGKDTLTKITIGGTTAGSGNLISGNGIGIAGNVQSSLIAGNLVGTDATGQAALGNGYGMYLGATGTVIGGTTAASRNVVAASGTISSGGTGIVLTGSSNTLSGNYIGTNSAGTAALPNQIGVELLETNSVVGGAAAGAGNLISGNKGDGLTLDNYGSNLILGNRIGTTAAGGALGNGGDGIEVILTKPAGTAAGITVPLNDMIGNTTGAGNVIANNVGAGVAVTANGVAFTGLSIRGNQISNNGDLGISLGTTPDVPTPGTLTITSTASTATGATVQGVLGGLPGQTYQVDVFSSPAADPTGYGQGRTYLGTASVVIGNGGLATFSKTFPTPVAAGSVVTATATNLLGSTSEFSAAYPNTMTLANLGITQTVSSATVVSGGTVTFTATITNTGDATARDVVYTDALPISLVNATVTASVGTASKTSDNIALVQLGDLAPGATATVTITANAAANGSVINTAGVIATTPDADYADNTATQTFTVGTTPTPTADLGITIAPSTTTPAVGANFTYTLTVTNGGSSAATNVLVNDFLPANVALVGATPSQGAAATVQGTLVSTNLGTIAAGRSATLTLTVRPTATGSLVDSANVAGNQLDPVASNNSASSTLSVGSAPVTTGSPLLTLTQTALNAVGTVGQVRTLTLTVRNVGTAAATGVILVDTLPSNVRYVSASPSQGSPATFANNVVTSNLGTIAAGGTATLTLAFIPTTYASGQVNFSGVVATGASPTAPVFSTVPLNVPNGPAVTSVVGSRSNAQLVVAYNEAITAASATTKANYRLYDLGASPRAITANDVPIAITTAIYNPTTHSVTLTPSRAIRASDYYALVIVGNTRTGITDTTGRKLVGTAGGSPGTNAITTFFAGTLAQA